MTAKKASVYAGLRVIKKELKIIKKVLDIRGAW